MLSRAMAATGFALAFVACGPASRAKAQGDEASKFYAGKQITLYIGSAIGGGYDAYARLIAQYMGGHIPGHPTIVPQNMPGAGSGRVVSHLLTSAPRDGTVIAAIEPEIVTARQLGRGSVAQLRTDSLLYLGSAYNEDNGCWVRSDASVKTFQDVFSKPLLVGASAAGGEAFDLPTVEDNLLGAKFKIISGYAGENEVLLAIDRNEVQGVCGTGLSAIRTQRPAWIKTGFIKMLVQESVDGSAPLNRSGVPRTGDYAKSPLDLAALRLIYSQQEFGRPYAMPPEVPAARARALRAAFVAALSDKRLLAEAVKMNLQIRALPGERMQTLAADLAKTAPAIVARARRALNESPAPR